MSALQRVVVFLVLMGLSAAAFHVAYRLDEPIEWADSDAGIRLKLMNHAEGWSVIQGASHPLSAEVGERVVAVETRAGVVHMEIRKISCSKRSDPSAVISQIDESRRERCSRYSVFWRGAPDEAAWHMERSFAKREGLKTIKRVEGPQLRLGTYIVFDYAIVGPEGCLWYVGAYLPDIFLRYYELDLKYALMSIELEK